MSKLYWNILHEAFDTANSDWYPVDTEILKDKVSDEALKELADSIKEHGVFQPIIVKKSVKGYNIIAGERRAKASLLAGKETIPAIIRDFSDDEMMQVALLENLQRENLSG